MLFEEKLDLGLLQWFYGELDFYISGVMYYQTTRKSPEDLGLELFGLIVLTSDLERLSSWTSAVGRNKECRAEIAGSVGICSLRRLLDQKSHNYEIEREQCGVGLYLCIDFVDVWRKHWLDGHYINSCDHSKLRYSSRTRKMLASI